MREDESELAALQLTTSVASNCGRTIGVVSEPLQHRWRILHTAYVRVHAYVRAQGEYPHTSAVCRILDLTCIQDTHTCPPAVYVSVYGYIMHPCVARVIKEEQEMSDEAAAAATVQADVQADVQAQAGAS